MCCLLQISPFLSNYAPVPLFNFWIIKMCKGCKKWSEVVKCGLGFQLINGLVDRQRCAILKRQN